MNPEKRWRLVCYDIRDDKRYRKVFKLLRGIGRSVQYSIFRCRLDDREIERLRWELAQLMAPEDALLVIDLCPSCASHVISRNHVAGWTKQEPTFCIAPSLDQVSVAGRAPRLAKRANLAITRGKRAIEN